MQELGLQPLSRTACRRLLRALLVKALQEGVLGVLFKLAICSRLVLQRHYENAALIRKGRVVAHLVALLTGLDTLKLPKEFSVRM